MKKYLVKEVSTGTAEHPNYAGETHVSWNGKDGQFCFDGEFYFPYLLNKYGYTRKADAKKNWTYRHPENTRYWTSTVEIVEFEV